MRTLRELLLTACCCSMVAASALAQGGAPPDEPPAPMTPAAVAQAPRLLSLGVRLHAVPDEIGPFHRMLDLRSGPTLDWFRYTHDRTSWQFDTTLQRIGYRDQRMRVGVEQFGRLQASFEWVQTPLLHGTVTRSPYQVEVPGVFRLDDTVRSGIQNQTATLADYEGTIRAFDTRARRDTAAARLTWALAPRANVHLTVTRTARTGEQPWGASFGLNNATVVPAPIDTRTTDVRTAAEWSSRRGMVRLAYDGSWFTNQVGALVWDNPLRVTDRTAAGTNVSGDASAQGRMALWPDSTAHTVSTSGSLALPARSRAFAAVSIGSWLQDGQLLPHTINSAIAPIPLARGSAEGEARITAMTYRFTSRPAAPLWISAQYRLHDFDTRTPHFPVTQYVRVDQVVGTSLTGGSHPFGYTRHFVDVDASVTPLRFTAFRVGFSQERDDRTFRFLEETTERTVRASVDSTAFAWGSARLQYDRSVRTGEGLDEQVFGDVGEQVSLRQFDIANRTRHRVSAIVQAIPRDTVGLNVTVAAGAEHRPESAFGLQDNTLRAVTVGAEYAPHDALSAGLSYGIERYSTTQQSRQANPGPQFNDPTRDWWADMRETVHTVSFGLELPRLTRRTAGQFAYDLVGSRSRYVYRVTPDTTLPQPVQLTPIRNLFHVLDADVVHTLGSRLALGMGYRVDVYDVEDFALSPGTLNSPLLPTFLNMMEQWRSYSTHTGVLRLIYHW